MSLRDLECRAPWRCRQVLLVTLVDTRSPDGQSVESLSCTDKKTGTGAYPEKDERCLAGVSDGADDGARLGKVPWKVLVLADTQC